MYGFFIQRAAKKSTAKKCQEAIYEKGSEHNAHLAGKVGAYVFQYGFILLWMLLIQPIA